MQARGLAERVAEDPPTIRLLFRHKNEDQVTGTDQFYSERKRNCCVACGESDHYLRYRVGLPDLCDSDLGSFSSLTQRQSISSVRKSRMICLGRCGGGCSGCLGTEWSKVVPAACRWCLPATGGPSLCT